MLARRWRFIVAGVALFLAGSGVTAFATHTTTVVEMTGCLNKYTGAITKVKQRSSTPLAECTTNEVVVHLSGGDITAVRTLPGSGLRGGRGNGEAVLTLDFAELDGRYLNTGEVNPGLAWRGKWTETTAYAINDAVSYAGSAYIAVSANQGEIPLSGAGWDVLAQQGETGEQGPAGPVGVTIRSTEGIGITYYDAYAGRNRTKLVAPCLPGETVLSGGYTGFWDSSETAVWESKPVHDYLASGESEPRQGWQIIFPANTGGQVKTWTVYATCAASDG